MLIQVTVLSIGYAQVGKSMKLNVQMDWFTTASFPRATTRKLLEIKLRYPVNRYSQNELRRAGGERKTYTQVSRTTLVWHRIWF